MHGHEFSNQKEPLRCISKVVFLASRSPSPRARAPVGSTGLSPAGQHRPAPAQVLSPPSLQEPALPSPGQPLAKPLTRLDGENPQHALDINKVVSDALGRGRGGGPWPLGAG